MASRFWVGGSGTWDGVDLTHIAATSGGAGGASNPGSGDTMTFDASSGAGAVITLGYSPTISTCSMAALTGTLDFNGYSPTMASFTMNGAGVKTFTGGNGTLTLTGIGTVFNSGGAGVTCSMASLNIVVSDVSGSAKALTSGGAGGSNIFGSITLTAGGAGAFTFNSNAKTFGSINITGPKSVVFTSSTTTTVTTWNVNGSAGNLVTITSSSAGTPATISKASGIVSSDYLSLKDSTATGGATFYAGANSTSVSGNTGWIFTAPPAGSNKLMMMGIGI